MSENLNNLPNMKSFRKNLRHNMTPAEAKLWGLLKHKSIGKKFRRQFSIGKYVLDFYCHESKLAIELDGEGHWQDAQILHDEKRTQFLEKQGICVLRFENKIVWDNSEWLLSEIKKRLT
jgi:very-short-patch-repair endonuclease